METQQDERERERERERDRERDRVRGMDTNTHPSTFYLRTEKEGDKERNALPSTTTIHLGAASSLS
jgi:hypothetical protein